MTVKELYEWAVKNGVEDYDLEVHPFAGGGYVFEGDILISEFKTVIIEA